MVNCWKVLGIRPTKNLDAIRSARRALVKVWHPDRAGTRLRKRLCDIRCSEINAAFDKAAEHARLLGRYGVSSVDAAPSSLQEKEKSTLPEAMPQTWLSSPYIWLLISGLLFAAQQIPATLRPIFTATFMGVASTTGVYVSARMVRTCSADQRANWLLLVIASAVVFLGCLYSASARAFGQGPAQVILVAAVVALPVWVVGFLFKNAS